MAETTRAKIPYPVAGDSPDGATQMESLAKRVDALLPIVGLVNSSGTVVAGTGFTAEKTATGKYTITLSTELASAGLMVACLNGTNGSITIEENNAKKVFKVRCFTLAGADGDNGFSFSIKQIS